MAAVILPTRSPLVFRPQGCERSACGELNASDESRWSVYDPEESTILALYSSSMVHTTVYRMRRASSRAGVSPERGDCSCCTTHLRA